MMKTHGVAIVGTGFIGPVHVEALRRLHQNVVGIMGSSHDRSLQAARSLGIPRAYSSYAELLADPAVEVVHLTSPNRHHFEQCRQAVQAGKHVVCEKPLAMNALETGELVRLAASANVVTAVCYNVRFYPLCLEARQRILSGSVGRIHHFTGSYLQDWLLHDTDFNWRVVAADGGELRAVADIGTHWMDLLQFVTGEEICEVCADLKTVHDVRHSPQGSVETFQEKKEKITTIPVPITTDDYGSILFRCRSNARGVFTVSQVTAGRKNSIRFDIAGEKSAFSWDSEEPNTMCIGYRDRPNESIVRDPSLLMAEARPFASYPGGHAEGFPDTFKQLFRAIYQAIDFGSGPVPYPRFLDGHREVVLCEAILRSHRERRWVSVEG